MVSTRLVILIGGFLVVSTLGNPTSRIWGGEEASKNSFTYVSSVRLDGAHICGGSIIGIRSILTAAHCVVDNNKKYVSLKRLAIRVGSTNQFSGGKLHYVSAISIHPNFDGERNDIAVLILELPLVWTERISMIRIATATADEPAPGVSVAVAGWGEQYPNVSAHKLHTMSFIVATEDACSDALSSKDNSSICLAHGLKKGSCVGDAGNGAAYRNKLIGVSTFVVGACGSRYPDVFSRVAHYAPWIETVLI